jgi:hypothetical protein
MATFGRSSGGLRRLGNRRRSRRSALTRSGVIPEHSPIRVPRPQTVTVVRLA